MKQLRIGGYQFLRGAALYALVLLPFQPAFAIAQADLCDYVGPLESAPDAPETESSESEGQPTEPAPARPSAPGPSTLAGHRWIDLHASLVDVAILAKHLHFLDSLGAS